MLIVSQTTKFKKYKKVIPELFSQLHFEIQKIPNSKIYISYHTFSILILNKKKKNILKS